ncbi:ladderlectin-like [Paramisgurnus dabryanus]|uniref:ladderlectin-like n=1 Tax=Paramisgurnus dabryanus TaxID=90735 RepID=UPI0031F41D84
MAVMRALMLLFLVFFVKNAAAEDCPYDWTPFGVECYKFISTQETWIKAEKNCQSNGGNLASVRSAVQNDFLLSLVPTGRRAWIGGQDGEVDGQWLWTDGSQFDFTNWCPKEPNNYQGVPENCLEISWNGQRCWNDQPCTDSMGYICAQPLL